MQRRMLVRSGVVLVVLPTCLRADLSAVFDGFDVWVKENKVSGMRSSYGALTQGAFPAPVTGAQAMPVLGPERVSYPGAGTVPSPGGATGRNFDEGALGIRVQGNLLTVRVAGGIDPQTGVYHQGWNTWYGQGDVFVTVDDSSPGVNHFALLNLWPRDGSTARVLDGSWFDGAQAFHYQSNEGKLVRLTADNQVVLTGGSGSYHGAYYPGGDNAPDGLDLRAYASGGTVVGDANLVLSSTIDQGLGDVSQTFWIQTWTFPLSWLSLDGSFGIALHKTTSCGNDQIELVATVPAPGAAVLAMIGLAAMRWVRSTSPRR